LVERLCSVLREKALKATGSLVNTGLTHLVFVRGQTVLGVVYPNSVIIVLLQIFS